LRIHQNNIAIRNLLKVYCMDYTVPSGTHIGHVHLKVSDIDKALSFYKDLLGFQIKARYGTQAVFLLRIIIIITLV
jgi:catechol-2,3-dioxygenase